MASPQYRRYEGYPQRYHLIRAELGGFNVGLAEQDPAQATMRANKAYIHTFFIQCFCADNQAYPTVARKESRDKKMKAGLCRIPVNCPWTDRWPMMISSKPVKMMMAAPQQQLVRIREGLHPDGTNALEHEQDFIGDDGADEEYKTGNGSLRVAIDQAFLLPVKP
ncbi:MAG: hypothetical protein MZV63_72425 [Marinilabiliales bacterium]|nr:hypothetical protein [Marinilabiliales bacterium]